MNPEIDFVIRGEGEYALLELATAIQRKSAYSGLRGLSYKVKGEYRENPVVFIENLDELPFPDREVLNHESRLKITGKTPIIGSRGSPIGCKFCSVSAMWGFRYRARSPVN
jgi:anaerobic magnesium-protoporphyrin IX monomethyl ester cyclase